MEVGGGGTGEGGTFEKVDSKTGFVNGPVRDELEPEAAGRALDVIRLLVATVAPDEGAALAVPVAHLQVVIGAAVVALNLGVRGSVSQHPTPGARGEVGCPGGNGGVKGSRGLRPTSKDWKVRPTWKPSDTWIRQMQTLLGR